MSTAGGSLGVARHQEIRAMGYGIRMWLPFKLGTSCTSCTSFQPTDFWAYMPIWGITTRLSTIINFSAIWLPNISWRVNWWGSHHLTRWHIGRKLQKDAASSSLALCGRNNKWVIRSECVCNASSTTQLAHPVQWACVASTSTSTFTSTSTHHTIPQNARAKDPRNLKMQFPAYRFCHNRS